MSEIDPIKWVDQEKARADLKQVRELFQRAYPVTSLLIGQETLVMREVVSRLVKKSLDEGDAVGLAILANWFVQNVSRETFLRFMQWLEEDSDDQDIH